MHYPLRARIPRNKAAGQCGYLATKRHCRRSRFHRLSNDVRIAIGTETLPIALSFTAHVFSNKPQ